MAALRGALGEGLVACGASLGISVVHMLWSLFYVRAGSRALSAAQRYSHNWMHASASGLGVWGLGPRAPPPLARLRMLACANAKVMTLW